MGAFWKVDLRNADAVLRQCLVSHIITAKHGVPLMIRQRRGLLVEVTESDMLAAGGNPLTQAVKVSQKGLVLSLAAELAPHDVAVIAVTPGFLRSEAMVERKHVTEATWRDAGKADPNLLESETPLFVGRAVAALAGDPDVMGRTGQLYGSWELARRYRFKDADGRRPDWGRAKIDVSRLPQSLVDYLRDGARIQLDWLSALSKRTRRFLSQLPPR